jgi:RNA polymerase sigma factor (sigma-70 family)
MTRQRRTAPPPDCRDGGEHREAFASAYQALYVPVCGYVMRRVREPEDAADVIAETFLVLWRRFEEAPSGDELRPWVYGVARRAMANQRRTKLRQAAVATRLSADLAEARNHLEPVYDVEADSGLRVALDALSSSDREILRLVAWEGLSPKELAIALGTSQPAARVRLHRARRRLADALRQPPAVRADEHNRNHLSAVPWTTEGVS